jgi:hypothetical protein
MSTKTIEVWTKGDALTPARFWDYSIPENDDDRKKLKELGYGLAEFPLAQQIAQQMLVQKERKQSMTHETAFQYGLDNAYTVGLCMVGFNEFINDKDRFVKALVHCELESRRTSEFSYLCPPKYKGEKPHKFMDSYDKGVLVGIDKVYKHLLTGA